MTSQRNVINETTVSGVP